MSTRRVFTRADQAAREAARREWLNLPFLMVVEDVFHIKGRGTVITGQVTAGRLKEGDPILIVGQSQIIRTYALRFELFGRLEEITVGDNIGILLPADVTNEQIKREMFVTAQEDW